MVPLELLLHHQCRRLETESSPSFSIRRMILAVLRNVVTLTLKGSVMSVRLLVWWPLKFLSRRRCLQPLRARLVRCRRRLLVRAVRRLVRLIRWCLKRSRGSRN